MAQWVENLPSMQESQFDPYLIQVVKIPWRRKWQPTPVVLPENPMGRRAWWAQNLKNINKMLLFMFSEDIT